MFHIKSLELVHWDYWQRIKNIPLDAKIITIAGQNGSGKTTLLDALRTLFGLDCSMGRSYKHYARHSGQATSWIRAVVDNRPVNQQLSSRPFRTSGFFGDDEVTLFCQIQKNGGDWRRQYLMRAGNISIEDVLEANDWLGVEVYRRRLAQAGLSNAMSKVLALEQGETDKLCEYSPKQLLNLVFQVFGDKEVLDAYDEAKRYQRETEEELEKFEVELANSKHHLESLRLRVASFHQWERLNKEKRDLQEEALPTLRYHEGRVVLEKQSQELKRQRLASRQYQNELSSKRSHIHALATQSSEARQTLQQLEIQQETQTEALAQINAQLKPLENLLAQKKRLQDLAQSQSDDVAQVATKLEESERKHLQLRQTRESVKQELAGLRGEMAAQSKQSVIPEPEYVRQFRQALNKAKIPHALLSEVVEVTDPAWQAAVEGLLKGYAFVVLLDQASDASQAYALAEKMRYSNFIVAKRVEGKTNTNKDHHINNQSLLDVVEFNAPVPDWLIEQLARIRRVMSVNEGLTLSEQQEWITPQAYHRERRGGRSLHVEQMQYRFGNAGKLARAHALAHECQLLETREDQLNLQLSKLSQTMSEYKLRLAGVNAAQELMARQTEFDEAAEAYPSAKAHAQEIGAQLNETLNQLKAAAANLALAEKQWQDTKAQLSDIEQQQYLIQTRAVEGRAGHAKQLLEFRHTWRNLPKTWRTKAHYEQLTQTHQNAHQANLRLKTLEAQLQEESWENDETVVAQFGRMQLQLQTRQDDADTRRYQNRRAIEATDNARAAYIERLRFTIKTYARNIKELGELAGIDVHTEPVKLENDDLVLAQAGLLVRFKFDGKGSIGMNDGEASGGQQVMKSLILLIGLLKSNDGSGGFVFIDEPFAHLDIRNIQLVGQFLKNTNAQYLMTTPLTHNTDVYDPSDLTLITSKKKHDERFAKPIFVLQRAVEEKARGR